MHDHERISISEQTDRLQDDKSGLPSLDSAHQTGQDSIPMVR